MSASNRLITGERCYRNSRHRQKERHLPPFCSMVSKYLAASSKVSKLIGDSSGHTSCRRVKKGRRSAEGDEDCYFADMSAGCVQIGRREAGFLERTAGNGTNAAAELVLCGSATRTRLTGHVFVLCSERADDYVVSVVCE